MSKAKVKSVKMAPFEKILNLMVSGEPMAKEDIGARLGDEIQIYRISTYMWHIKMNANGIIRVIKDGRKVVAYQLVNPSEIVKYLKNKNIYSPVETVTAVSPAVEKLEDLKAEPSPVVAEPVAKVQEEMEVIELIDTEQA
jgi:hypothetical protein